MTERSRLLILNCSKKKRRMHQLPAVELYDGPSWRVLRKYLRNPSSDSESLEVYGLSAKHGLLAADELIEPYDELLTRKQARAIEEQVQRKFRSLVSQDYDEIGVALTSRYLDMLNFLEGIELATSRVVMINGPMGEKLGRLKCWLEQRPFSRPQRSRIKAKPDFPGFASIGETSIQLSRDEVIAIAREYIETDQNDFESFRNWYVIIDGKRIGTKWLVSILADTPTSEFSAVQSRKALLDLGFDIEFKP